MTNPVAAPVVTPVPVLATTGPAPQAPAAPAPVTPAPSDPVATPEPAADGSDTESILARQMSSRFSIVKRTEGEEAGSGGSGSDQTPAPSPAAAPAQPPAPAAAPTPATVPPANG